MEIVKKFALNSTQSSLKERDELFTSLFDIFEDQVKIAEIPEGAIKLLSKLVPNLLTIYIDKKSKSNLIRLIDYLVKINSEHSLKNILHGFEDISKTHVNVYPNRSSSTSSLYAIDILNELFMSISKISLEYLKPSNDVFKRFVIIYGNLSFAASSFETQKSSDLIYKKIKNLFDRVNNLASDFTQALANSSETNVYSLVLCDNILKYYKEKSVDCLEARQAFLELLNKHLLSVRSKLPIYVSENCNTLVKYATRDDFKERILPALQRALLRNPETILESLDFLLNNLTIDLSDFSKDLIKILGSQLMAKGELNQRESCLAIKSLAQKCSSNDAIQHMIKHLFFILNGGEGKPSTANQKINIINSIGYLSYNCALLSQETLFSVLEAFNDFLKIESHEGTQTSAFVQLDLWFVRCKTSIKEETIKKINEIVKKLIENKSFTPNVRCSLYQAICTFYSENSLSHHLASLMPLISQSIDRALASLNQIHLVQEALSASLLLATILSSDLSLESKVPSFFAQITDSIKRPLFTNDKFYMHANESSLRNYCLLFIKLYSLGLPKDKLNLKSYYTGYTYVLLHSNYEVRKQAQNLLKLAFKSSGSELAFELIETIQNSLENTCGVSTTNGDGVSEVLQWPSSKAICEASLLLVSICNLTHKELETLALKSLLLSNHKLAKSFDYYLYDKCLHRLLISNQSLNIMMADLIESQVNSFLKSTTNTYTLNESQLNAIETLSRIDGKHYLSEIVSASIGILKDTRMMSVTKPEVEIMHLNEGELHDRTLIEAALKSQESNQNPNVKRENKNYTYKEQLAEIELKKELEARRKTQAPNELTLDQARALLSKKQQELLDAQIQRENKIRVDTRHLNDLAHKATQMLLKSLDGNPNAFKNHIFDVVNIIITLIRSPLCSGYMFKIYLALGNKIFSQFAHTFVNGLVNLTFRLDGTLKIASNWNAEPVDQAAKRNLSKILTHSKANQLNFDISESSFILPFIHLCLSSTHVKLNADNLMTIVELVNFYASFRVKLQNDIKTRELNRGQFDDEQAEKDEIALDECVFNFPSSNYISLLIRIIQTNTSIKLQNEVNSTLRLVFLFTSHLNENHLSRINERFLQEIREITNNLLSASAIVRETCLNCIETVKSLIEKLDHATFKHLEHHLWLTMYDENESNKVKASQIWSEANMSTRKEDLCFLLLENCIHPIDVIRESGAKALASCLKNHPEEATLVLRDLLDRYDVLNKIPEAKRDQFGRVTTEEVFDDWQSRSGIAQALVYLADLVPNSFVIELYSHYVNKALNDRNQTVKNKMLEASIAGLNKHGNSHKNELLNIFEKFLEAAPKTRDYDVVRQNVVILMGTLAKHLDRDDPKIAPIIGKLVQALQTPSQQVQEAVANCLPPLMSSIKPQISSYVDQLMALLLSNASYGERRGAAYGLAGMLKGAGMLSLRQMNVLQRLNEAINSKSDPKKREGALLAYEMLTIIFSKLFEPFIVDILPNLLLCFGDQDNNVRLAADDCAKAIMSNLTPTGAKLILPKLLEKLNEDEHWRTKCGSVELLGAMAHCAPKQLGTCLPSIVPKLIEVLSDSHLKVQSAGTQALRQIGSVIKNPEIQAISPTLIQALQDPAEKTQKSLGTLLETKFVHFIDAPSLALIMPVVQRAFQDRSTETRKMAAQIMGNMYSLTDQKDLLPYLPAILPGLKESLLDPVPDVRSVSARALGAMIRAIGENGLNELVSWLMEKLVSEVSSVDRSGAAQGLSEVFGALGVAKLEKSMPEIIERAEQVDLAPYVRDGYIMMFIYLPITFVNDFMPYVGRIIPSILKALADESEYVRDTALKAGQSIVNTYADTAISLFLPELEKGLLDSNWRIRLSSIQLLGDLLYKISGVQGKMTTESLHEDDNFGTETGTKSIVHSLGEDRRNRVYAGLYMGRSDVSLLVRQAALHVWKVIVSNTPKTLKEILPTLFNLLLGCLASSSHDKRQIAAATLVDIVKKLGERILPDIIPILERGLNSERSEQRQGVCIGLTEIMGSTSKDNILTFSDSLIPTVRRALMDHLPEVRATAARTFDSLHNMIGVKALDEVCGYLLEEMNSSEHQEIRERALDGLQQIMIVKSRVLLPYLIPTITQPPVNVPALSKLCCCASIEVLSRHFNRILNTLVHAFASYGREGSFVQECESLLLAIEDDDGVKTIITELLSFLSDRHPASDANYKLKLAALDMLTLFCTKSEADYEDYVDDLIKSLLAQLADRDLTLVTKAWECLNAVIDTQKGNSLIQRLPAIRQAIRILIQQQQFNLQKSQSQEETKRALVIHGFCIPKKGINCILPVFKEGLLQGTPDIKEQAAQCLCDCIKVSDGESLKTSAIAITGPLIRVLGERYSWSVKSAVLDAIYHLLLKVDMTLRPFVPQLQPTFLKAIIDQNRLVRYKSSLSLARLLPLNPKVDQVINEISNAIKNNDDIHIRETLLNCLRMCLNSVGTRLGDDTKKQLLATLKSDAFLYNQEAIIRIVCAGAVGSLCALINDTENETLMSDLTNFSKYQTDFRRIHANAMVLEVALKFDAKRTLTKSERVLNFIASTIANDNVLILMSSMRVIGYLLVDQVKNSAFIEATMAVHLAKCINNNSNEVKQLSVQIVNFIACSINEVQVMDDVLLKTFIPMLVNGTKERMAFVRQASEIALINLLQLNKSNGLYDRALSLVEKMNDPFVECVRALSKESMQQANMSKDLDIDETLLKVES